MGHRKPAAWNNPAVAQHDDAAFRLKTLGEVFHDRRLADAGCADKVHYAMPLQSRMGLIDQFGAGEPYTADLDPSISFKRVVCRLRQAGVNKPQVRSLVKAKSMLRDQWVTTQGGRRPAGSCAGASFDKQDRP